MTVRHQAHVIVFGNEKGGCGKSTSALLCAVGLMHLGFKVSVLDLDINQRTCSRFFENRENVLSGKMSPALFAKWSTFDPDGQDLENQLTQAVSVMAADSDFIIIDTPGSKSDLSHLGHTFADTLVTPINDSFVDLDLLVEIRGSEDWRKLTEMSYSKPSRYAAMVAEVRKQRMMRDRAGLDWVVLRNRVAPFSSNNNKRITEVINFIGPKLGFRFSPGLTERVVYRELFPYGMTLTDLALLDPAKSKSSSLKRAYEEMEDFLRLLWLPKVDLRLKEIQLSS